MEDWKDLAPDICRQRLVIEGTLHNPFGSEDMTRYCHEITKVLNMTEVTSPMCNYDPNYGWCAYTHWKESGMHIYSWMPIARHSSLLIYIPARLSIRWTQSDTQNNSLGKISSKSLGKND